MTDSTEPLFGSMFMGGFECATHKLRGGRRLDLLASTGHDARAAEDYALLKANGMRGARDALRWHLIEQRPGRYDWSSFLPMLHAARDAGIAINWDLLHYGVPNGVDVFAPGFVTRFAAFAGAAAAVIRAETDAPAVFTPVNEISFWAWAGGDTQCLNPFAVARGGELKRQLVRATLAAGDTIRAVDPRARIAVAEPLIHIFASEARPGPEAEQEAAAHNEGQFEALDMLLGRRAPELGGHADAIDIVGINYYYNNQWVDHGRTIYLGDGKHLPLRGLLGDVVGRYGKPLYIAETGTEGIFRPFWLRYIAEEVMAANAAGAGVGGICLYPILSHLGWDDERHCPNGLIEAFGPDWERRIYAPLAEELALQVARFTAHPAGQAMAAGAKIG